MTLFKAAIRPVLPSRSALTSASPARDIRILLEVLNERFRAVAFSCHCSATRGCYAGRNGYPRWQFSRDRQIEQRQTEGFRVIKNRSEWRR